MKKPLMFATLGLFGLASLLFAFGAAPAGNLEIPTGETGTLKLEELQNPGSFHLDHFKVYFIEEQPAAYGVRLRGQFDQQFIGHNLVRYTRFLNPVDKNGEGIIDKYRHLNWYDTLNFQVEPIRVITLYNQFGLQTIKIGQPVALLAPADKIEPGSQPPQGLDHYKVYEVISADPVDRQVALKDQFGSHENIAIIARYFAVPVEKWHNGQYFPIVNPEDHLVFYVLEPKEINEYRPTKDQFGVHDMKTLYCELLGVPSKKIAWTQ